MKTYLLLLTLAVSSWIFLPSCDSLTKNGNALLSNSTGGFDEILVVADKSQLENYLRKPLREVFAASYEVLPQGEPFYDLRIIGYEDFDKIFRRFRTIVFVADLGDNTSISDFVTENIGEEYVLKAMNDDNFYYALKKNIWADPQLIIFVFSARKEKLLEKISTGMKPVLEIIANNELDKYKNNAFFNGANKEITDRLAADYRINMNIPEVFLSAKEDPDFVWLRKITPEFSVNIIISTMPLDSIRTTEQIIAWRNELSKKYVSGKIEGSYMVCDTLIPAIVSEKKINGLSVRETRGLWKMEGDFMGGPYMNYLITDVKNNRTIMLDGFVHAPGEKKKPEMRNLEAIFSGFKIP